MTQGDWIKKARTDAGVTQEELANVIGTTKQTIHKYEMNIVTNIPMDKTKAMAEFLNVTPSQLLGWDVDSKPEPEDETLKLAEELRNRPGMRLLFDATKNCTEEDMRKVAAMIKAFRGEDD
jgi:transcriptional regulator with XRE-family HTH domain